MLKNIIAYIAEKISMAQHKIELHAVHQASVRRMELLDSLKFTPHAVCDINALKFVG